MIVEPLDIQALQALKARAGNHTYRSSPQMQMNLERSAQVYPHRLYTPEGIGNDKEFSPHFGEGR